jgi:hypothetical protein
MMQRVVTASMSEPSISLDTDAAAATAADWRAYGDRVEQHGATPHTPIAELRAAVGDVYAETVDAIAGQYEARQAAYQRVAHHARGHADRLDGTRQILTSRDDEGATRISGVLNG